MKYELSCYPTRETGGIFLGTYEHQVWNILESVFPGPEAKHESASFQCDDAYTNYEVNKLANLYDQEVRILGLWHSHITSSPFSLQDRETNHSFAALNPYGAISMLIDAEKKDYSIYVITQSGDYIVESDVRIQGEGKCLLSDVKDILFSAL